MKGGTERLEDLHTILERFVASLVINCNGEHDNFKNYVIWVVGVIVANTT